MALNININLIKDFTNYSQKTFTIKNTNPHINSYVPEEIALAMTRGYADVKRRCFYIRNARYTAGRFRGRPVLETIFSELYSFITKLNSYSNQTSFDTAHDNLCSSLCGDYTGFSSKGRQGNSQITYGITQKLVNMTLKYLYVAHRLNPGLNLLPNNSVEGFFHCPVDSYILRKLRLADPNYFRMISATNSTVQFCRKSWSKFSRDNYICFLRVFRNKLQSGIKQLEVDFYLWSNSPNALSQSVVKLLRLRNNSPTSLIGNVFNNNSVSPSCC